MANTNRTREQLAQAIAEKDRPMGAASRMAELVAEGCDYDEIAQRLTDTYAEWLGVEQDWDNPEYELTNEIANTHLEQELTDK